MDAKQGANTNGKDNTTNTTTETTTEHAQKGEQTEDVDNEDTEQKITSNRSNNEQRHSLSNCTSLDCVRCAWHACCQLSLLRPRCCTCLVVSCFSVRPFPIDILLLFSFHLIKFRLNCIQISTPTSDHAQYQPYQTDDRYEQPHQAIHCVWTRK
jgi:hypothetical protein